MNYPPTLHTRMHPKIVAYRAQRSDCCGLVGLVFACCDVWICSEILKPIKLLCKIAVRIFISHFLYMLSASKTDCSLECFVRQLFFGVDSP